MASTKSLKPSDTEKVVLEAWSQGFMVGALIIMCGITLANLRKGVLLHKLILIELVLAIPNGFFMFFEPPVWGWFLSSTVVPLVTSWTLHNVIAWIKNKPFLGRKGNIIYISSIILVQPYWVLEIYANFTYFNGINNRLFKSMRPYEAVFRDPWWIFTIANLFWNIKFQYELKFSEIIKISPRFGILLGCMCLSVICIIIDLLSVTPVVPIGVINPFWKFAFVFKCFTDSIILDDFKTALDKLSLRSRTGLLPFHSLGASKSTRDVDADQGGRMVPRTSHKWQGVGSKEADEGVGCTHIELSDVGELCPPSPAVIHIEDSTKRWR
ncbi:hypothetical protein FB567DRAFT_444305 [Paraphoma chrysanthemicola]|uniref:Uncharacterized protein n=1 Tax=Paraphoma chrysanthemicola TaxID=798071 RepID=A0A8K0VY82_9PLEO|nr:hypothetical protein FB567DRAFT_444305 [Paraphoma chrysanthemicola]